MVNPQFISEEHLSLADVKVLIKKIQKRDEEVNYRTNKANDFLDNLDVILSQSKKDELTKKLLDLNLTRLKEEHIMKITDFLPTTTNDLKIVLQAYPLSMPKKDQESIVKVVKEFKT